MPKIKERIICKIPCPVAPFEIFIIPNISPIIINKIGKIKNERKTAM